MGMEHYVKLNDGTLFDPTVALTPFDLADWRKGLEFDLSSKTWGGKGGIRDKTRTIRIHKAKPAKVVRSIKPAIAALADNDDQGGRSVPDHRAMVEWYEHKYDSGEQLFNDDKITDPKEQGNIAKPRPDRAWADGRGAANTDADGLKLLANAFQAMHDDNNEDD